jgi:hypothetical protein
MRSSKLAIAGAGCQLLETVRSIAPALADETECPATALRRQSCEAEVLCASEEPACEANMA